MTTRMPYPGLRAFRRDEADVFFGRDDCIDDMVDRLAETRFLAVLGASGSGKSSLVRTGMLHALALGFNARAGSNWMIAEMHPGSNPIAALAESLLSAKQVPYGPIDVDLLTENLRRSPSAIVQWCQAGHLPPGCNLLILADQFEELFRYGDYGARETAEAFVNLLLESADAPDVPVSIVLTMRSEFLAACTLFDGLAERINAGLYLTPRMTREACELAIEGPAMVCGFTVEPTLVNSLINDMTAFAPWEEGGTAGQIERLSRRADQLPLMQHVLNLMWLRAEARGGPITLTKDEYDALGGLKGALDEHGAAIIARLGLDAEPAVETVFRALVSGSSAALAVRRPTAVDEIVALAHGDRATVLRVIEAFRAPDCNFLQPPSTVPLAGTTVIDLSHESLIRQWSVLAAWTAKEARSAESWRRLNAATARHASGEGGLLQGLDLATVAAWWDAERPGPIWQARFGGDHAAAAAFLTQSRAAHDAVEASRLAVEAREKRGLRRRAAAYAGLALLSTGSSLFAMYEWGLVSAESKKAKTAQERVLRAQAALLVAARDQKLVAEKALADAKARRAAEKLRDEAEHRRLIQQQLADAMTAQALNERIGRLKAEKDKIDVDKRLGQTEALALKLKKSATTETLDGLTEAERALSDSLDRRGKQEVADISQSNAGTSRVSGATDTNGSALSSTGRMAASDVGRIKPTLMIEVRNGIRKRIEPEMISRAREQRDRLQAGYARLRSVPSNPRATAAQLADFGDVADNFARLQYSLDNDAPVASIIAEVKDAAKRLRRQGDARAARALELRSLYLDVQIAEGNPLTSKAADQRVLPAVAASEAAPDRSEIERAFVLRAHIYATSALPLASAERRAALERVCAEAEAAVRDYPANSFMQRQLARCRWQQAINATSGTDAIYNDVNEGLRRAVRDRPNDQILAFSLFEGLARQASDLAPEAKDRSFALRQEALDALIRAIADRAIETELIGAGIAAPLGWALDADYVDRDQELGALLKAERALATSGTAFPKSELGYRLADVRRRIGEALLRSPAINREAFAYLRLADAAYDASDRLDKDLAKITKKPLPKFSESFANICGPKLKIIAEDAKNGQITEAVNAFNAVAGKCNAALTAYPYDFYLRYPYIAAQAAIGAALQKDKRHAEAAPYLIYGSKWGEADSSRQLADLYDAGQGVARDQQKAAELRKLAERQSTKRFTVPVSNGARRFPFFVYVRQWPAEYYESSPKGLGLTGIRDQAQWLEAARELKVPDDVISSFDKLQKIAVDNNVSFPDLAVYALGAAEQSAKDGTDGASVDQASPIVAQIRATDFRRGQGLATDKAGVILGGFDAVAYFDQNKAVASDARLFVLWNGAIWLFANEANRQKFVADPKRYMPAFGGYCAACAADGSVVESDPRQFVVRNGLLYLFSNESTRSRWLKNPEGYVRQATEQLARKTPANFAPVTGTKLGNAIVDALKASPLKDGASKPKL